MNVMLLTRFDQAETRRRGGGVATSHRNRRGTNKPGCWEKPPSSRRVGAAIMLIAASISSVIASISGVDWLTGDVDVDCAAEECAQSSCTPLARLSVVARNRSWAFVGLLSVCRTLCTGDRNTKCARMCGCPGVASAPQQIKGRTRPKMTTRVRCSQGSH